MKPTLCKILPFLTLLSSTGVLVAASWVLVTSWILAKTCSGIHHNDESCSLESTNDLWKRSDKLTFVLQASCGGSALATFLQVCVCFPLLCATEKKLKSRLRAWELFGFIALIIELTSFLLPFTFDPDTDTYIGINTLARETKQRLIQIKELFSEDIDLHSSMEFLQEQFNAYFILLCCNIILTFIFLIMNTWCFCCCCCNSKRANSKGHRRNLGVTKAKNKSKDQSRTYDYLVE